jgi:hypothetical protein
MTDWSDTTCAASTSRWQTKKYKGKKLIQTAFGSTFDQAMIPTTMGGPEPDER